MTQITLFAAENLRRPKFPTRGRFTGSLEHGNRPWLPRTGDLCPC